MILNKESGVAEEDEESEEEENNEPEQ